MRIWTAGVLSLAALGVAWAGPGGRSAMVLAVKGAAQVQSAQGAAPARVGAVLMWGDKVSLPAGSELTVLLLDKGQRQQLQGPGTVVVGDGSVACQGGSSRTLETPKVVAALTARNFRRIGGQTVRDIDPLDVPEFADVRLSQEGKGATCRLEVPTSELPRPLHLNINLEAGFGGMDVDLVQVKVGAREPRDTLAKWKDVAPQAVGQAWVYTVVSDVALPTGTTLALRAYDSTTPGGRGQLLFCRVRILTSTELSTLEDQRSKLETWAQRDPGDPSPYLILAGIYDDADRLGPGLESIAKALQRLPDDPGLLACRAHLELDLGHYRRALEDLKRSK